MLLVLITHGSARCGAANQRLVSEPGRMFTIRLWLSRVHTDCYRYAVSHNISHIRCWLMTLTSIIETRKN
jgi:hypothetical protein